MEQMWVCNENCGSTFSLCSIRMSEESSRLPAEPISAVGVLASIGQGPDGYYVVSKTAQTLDEASRNEGTFDDTLVFGMEHC